MFKTWKKNNMVSLLKYTELDGYHSIQYYEVEVKNLMMQPLI